MLFNFNSILNEFGPYLLECKESSAGINYMGTVNISHRGDCIAWSDVSDGARNYLNNNWNVDWGWEMLESNYCRNPDADPSGPWCYISTGSGSYGYCYLPVCGKHYHFNLFILQVQEYKTHYIPLYFENI